MITLTDLKTYYSARLIAQYRGKPRAKATIEALVQESWLDGLIQTEMTCFDLETAVGAQLDIIGRIVGVSRNIYGLDLTHVFFETTDYDETIAGVDMQVYSDTPDGPEIMLRYRSDAIYTMSDFEMRTLIKIKIIFNMTYRSAKDIIDSMFALFGSDVEVVDNVDLTMTFNVSEPYHNIFLIAEYINILPKPIGIEATVNNV